MMARKKKPGLRGKSGRLLDPSAHGRGPQQAAILPQTMIRRAEMVGMQSALRVEAESAVGRLLLAGRVSQAQYDAALKLVAAWRQWAMMAHVPPRHAKPASYGEVMIRGPRPDVSPEEWVKARDRYMGAVQAVGLGLAWATVESLVIDNQAPPRIFENNTIAERVYNAMIGGLSALVRYFGIATEKAA